jgi:DNA polymerase III sliding clamp (beta) subunit (PCNA family)
MITIEQLKTANEITKQYAGKNYDYKNKGKLHCDVSHIVAQDADASYRVLVDDIAQHAVAIDISSIVKVKADIKAIEFKPDSLHATVQNCVMQYTVEASNYSVEYLGIGDTVLSDSSSVDTSRLIESLGYCKGTASTETTRFNINGIYYDAAKKRLVSTDGHRLRVVEIDLFVKDNFFIKLEYFNLVLRFLKMHGSVILETRNQLRRKENTKTGEKEEYQTFELLRLVSANNKEDLILQQEHGFNYPDYPQVMPKNSRCIIGHYDIKPFVSALDKFKGAIKKTDGIVFDVDATGDLELSYSTSKMKVESCAAKDAPIRFCLNYHYVCEALKALKKLGSSDFILLGKENTAPFVVQSSGYNVQEIIMPMRFEK